MSAKTEWKPDEYAAELSDPLYLPKFDSYICKRTSLIHKDVAAFVKKMLNMGRWVPRLINGEIVCPDCGGIIKYECYTTSGATQGRCSNENCEDNNWSDA